jgi:hypothetical protein
METIMIKTKIFAAAAAVTLLAGTAAMAQDITPRSSVTNRGYDSNAAYGDNWDNDGPSYRGYRGGYARYGNDWDRGNNWDRGQGWSGGSAGIPTRSDRGANNGYSGGDNGAYRSGYAQRNGFVCEPGTVFINPNGIRTLCQ